MDNIELATLAGFFAGEGTIILSNGEWPTLYVAVGNTEKFWTQKLQDAFPSSHYVEATAHYPRSVKRLFRWKSTGKRAANFLRTIQPFLQGEKTEQLKVALRFQDIKDEPRNGMGSPLTAEQKTRLASLVEEMHQLRFAAAETNRVDAEQLSAK